MFRGRQIECHYCHSDQNSFQDGSKQHHNHTESIIIYACEQSKIFVQNWKYFWFVVAILKDRFAVDSNIICLASVSSTSTKNAIIRS